LHWLEWFASYCGILLSFLIGFSGLLLFSEFLLALIFLLFDLSLFTLFLGLVDFASWDEFSHKRVGFLLCLEISHFNGCFSLAFKNVAILIKFNNFGRFLTAVGRVQARVTFLTGC
jgi:hypothetical protein